MLWAPNWILVEHHLPYSPCATHYIKWLNQDCHNIIASQNNRFFFSPYLQDSSLLLTDT